MQLDKEQIRAIGQVIERAKNILIIIHKSPDGDTAGSGLGLYKVFKNLGKNPEIHCYDPTPPEFNFMPNIEAVQVGLAHTDFDTVFIVDHGATHLSGFHESHPQLFNKSMEVVNIDHHSSNDFFGKYNLVDPKAASATAVVYTLLKELNLPIDRDTATCLLTGIYTDTGSFMHSNTSSEILNIASDLLNKGANLRSISSEIFRTTKVSTMRLWGRVLKNIYQTPEGVTMTVVRKKDFEESRADYSEMTGVVDYVNSVPGAAYSVILTERDGVVKGSLRTLQPEVDVAKIASQYGGGGHIKAAGFTVKGKLEQEVRWKVVDK